MTMEHIYNSIVIYIHDECTVVGPFYPIFGISVTIPSRLIQTQTLLQRKYGGTKVPSSHESFPSTPTNSGHESLPAHVHNIH
jgi:hypothetical protein